MHQGGSPKFRNIKTQSLHIKECDALLCDALFFNKIILYVAIIGVNNWRINHSDELKTSIKHQT